MLWRRKRREARTEVEADTELAQQIRREIIDEQITLSQGFANLLSRKAYNGFGEDMQITFTPTPRPARGSGPTPVRR